MVRVVVYTLSLYCYYNCNIDFTIVRNYYLLTIYTELVIQKIQLLLNYNVMQITLMQYTQYIVIFTKSGADVLVCSVGYLYVFAVGGIGSVVLDQLYA